MAKWKWGKALIEGYSNKPQKGYTEVEPDAGIPFRRLKFTDYYDIVTCSFVLSRKDYMEVLDWYRNDIRQGTIPFIIFDCRFGLERTAHLIGDVPQYTTISHSKYFNLQLNMAFEPALWVSEDMLLAEGNDIVLVVNEDDALVVNQSLTV